MKQFLENERIAREHDKKLNRWAAALIILGFLATWGGMSTEDNRDKMPAEKAKKELASPYVTFGMMGAGLASMFGGAMLLLKRKQGKNQIER